VKSSYIPRIVPQPLAYQGMQRGINHLIAAIRPTLGPLPRTVAIARYSSESPEILDDGGTIARRILELPDRGEDIGAMYLRSMLWRLHQEVGDGTATAAILFGTIYNEGLRYIAAGANPMQLREYLENGMRIILDQISSMAFPLSGKEALTQLATSVCSDPPLAEALGEIFDAVGGYGQLEISIGHDRGLEREYQEGSEWWSGVHSRHMIYDKVEQGTRLQNASILLTDFSIEDADQLVPVLETALSAGKQALVIVAQK
jgi:chaperonin GroEL